MANTISLTQDYPVITRSKELYDRATGLIPAYTQTLAKGPRQYVVAPRSMLNVVRVRMYGMWMVTSSLTTKWLSVLFRSATHTTQLMKR